MSQFEVSTVVPPGVSSAAAPSGDSAGLIQRLNIIPAVEFCSPPPPPVYLVEAMITLSSICLLAGPSATNKSWLALSIALAVAGGTPVLGRRTTQTCVAYMNFEASKNSLLWRLWRLRIGHGHQGPLNFQACQMPSVRLNDAEFPEALHALAANSGGRLLVIIDTQRAATPGIDENASDVRACIDATRPFLDDTGSALLVLHHARKEGSGKSRDIIRGSSAILDAVDSAFVTSRRDPDGPTTVECVKMRDGVMPDAFEVELEDVQPEGLRLRLVQSPLITAGAQARTRLTTAVLDFISSNPGCSQRAIMKAVGGRPTIVSEVIRELERNNVIINTGSSSRHSYVIARNTAP